MNQVLHMLRDLSSRLIHRCAVAADNGVTLFTPDGMGNYAALWTRDFAYMTEYAGDLFNTDEIRNALVYLLEHARSSDGWIPDRVDHAGVAVYAAGSPEQPCGEPNLDNGPFAVILADCLLNRLSLDDGRKFLLRYGPALIHGMTAIPIAADGLVYNPPEKPHSPYGFTDCICKTGKLMMESLLYWRACRMLSKNFEKFLLFPQEQKEFSERASAIEASLDLTFRTDEGMLLAATGDCRQIDVWGSCYAAAIGFPLDTDPIARWLIGNQRELLQNGQLRHTSPGEYWEKCLIPVAEGEYQNGAYWATAAGWYALAVKHLDPELAAKVILDAAEYFAKEGVFECINGSYRKLDSYVVSATNVYGAAKELFYEIPYEVWEKLGRSGSIC